ncbi:hypothetical protein [Alkalihalobacillus sp. CinArs1]|uniref:hypothetical protein n=1 Tax=Alkalihalobacillus sp. CinArs1 TaxID=2995314 RepID=UPI0022DD51E8|nr:hypothetical protein [Alkalihalobacillus sp. CinArs1]
MFFLIAVLVFTIGCSTIGGDNLKENASEQNVRTVLQKQFNGPDEEQEKLITSYDGDLETYATILSEYNKEHFKPYMSERYYENYIVKNNGSLMFLRMAHPNHVLKVRELTIKENEDKDAFDFTVNVTTATNSESKPLSVEGTAHTNEDGKITSIHYLNIEDIRTTLDE